MESEILGFSIEQIVTVLAFVGAFATVLALAMPFLQRDHRAARLRTISRAREDMSRQQAKQREARTARWRTKKSINLLQVLVERLSLEKMIAPKGLKQKLVQAGYRQPYAAKVYVGLRFLMAVGAAVGAFAYMTLVIPGQLEPFQRLIVQFGAPLVGFYLPHLLVVNQATKRRKEMQLVFPDALDLLVICSEAGLSIEAAFQRVTNEMEEVSPILAEEFGLTSAELAFLGDRRRAYVNLSERSGVPAAKSLAVTLLQSEKYGTSVRQALRVLAQENRTERLMTAERKAAALPAKLTVPMIVFFLPVLMMVIMGPAIIKVMQM
jgi:tight adherence protein C